VPDLTPGPTPARLLFLAAPLFLVLSQTPPAAPMHNLMPVPASVNWTGGRVPLLPTFTVAVAGFSDARLRAAIDRAMRRLEGRTGYTLARTLAAGSAAATLVVDCRGPGNAIPSIDEDESYAIDASGTRIALRAPTVVGALRGLETVLQLVSGDRDGFFVPAVRIEDRPRFRWRGLLIDVGRHFEPVEVIKRELDGMAAVKLNVLHWHLSEDQGFRVESRRYPKLHQLGSDGQYYTQDELRDVVEYARLRGIRVVPEFDMPGHVTSWVVGYPELASAPGPYEIIRGFGVFDAAFDPTRESTYRFIDRFIGEMAPIFPDAYWHIGGDENNGKQWKANPRIQSFMEDRKIADEHALQTHFNQRLLVILRKHGKRMMGWDEILQPGLPKETIIHSWRGQQSLVEAARQGYEGVLSAGYYIDLLQTSATHYTVDPLPASSILAPADAARILGGEATMWGEWVGPETIDSRLWPRVAAIAERFWSPREVTDVDDMYRRLAAVSIQLEEVGLTHQRNRGVLLRRLAGAADVSALEVLAGVVEPVKGYQRGSHQRGTTFLPLTHLVDAVSTDSMGAREISRLIDGMLNDAPRFVLNRERLAGRFAAWREARPALEALIDRAPALREVAPLARDLADLGAMGQEALGFLAVRGTPTAEWRERTIAALDQATRPKAALEFPFGRAMRELVFAALEQAQLGALAPADWRARVRELAAPPRRGRGGGPLSSPQAFRPAVPVTVTR
jgi:hexosaminidase